METETVIEEENYRLLGDLILNFATRQVHQIFFARYENVIKKKWGEQHSSGKQFFETRPPKECNKIYSSLCDEDKKKLEGDPHMWDITMLDKVLSNIDFSSQNTALKNEHDEENRHIKAIKNVRNTYSHPTQKRIPQVDFEDLWKKAKAALVALGSSESEIDEMEASRYVTSFKLFEPPTNKFTGRKELLQKIHKQMLQCSTKTDCLDRIVVLSGLGGIGKSELARKYARTYIEDPIIQNVAWIDAEEVTGIKFSFVSIANRFKIPTEGKDLKEIAKLVYAHFSNHIKNGLFIFDNSKQMDDRPFGIHEYLPIQESLKQRPLVLLTARDQEWNIPNENVITVSELSQRESIELLQKKFRLAKEDTNFGEYEKLVAKLAVALQGYPLGLALATSNIKSNKDWTRLKGEIERYVERIGEPQGNWIGQDQRRAATKYKLIMENVWEVTLEKIKALEDEGQNAINLLSLIAYFPPDRIEKDQIERIFEALYSTALTTEVFVLLEKYSLLKVETLAEYYRKNEEVHLVRVHRLVQLTTRDKLDRERDFSYLFGLCNYFTYPEQNEEFHEQDKMMALHELVKERNYPDKSIEFSLTLCSISMCSSHFSYIKDVGRDLWSFLKTDESREATRIIAGDDVINLFYLCMFWMSSSDDKDIKCEDIILNEKDLETVFGSVAEPSTAFALTSTEGPKTLQEHSYVLFMRLLPNVMAFNKKSSSELIPRIASTLKATFCSSLKYISTVYQNLWKLLELQVPNSLALLGPIYEKHFQLYDRLGSKDEVVQYWGRGFWEDGPLNLYFINHQLNDEGYRECSGLGGFKATNDFVETFIRARGVEILRECVVFLTQYKISFNDSYALSVVRSLAVYLKTREDLVKCTEFVTAFCDLTKLVSKGNYSPWHKFNCVMGWFSLYSRQKPDGSDTNTSIHTIAPLLDEILNELKEVDSLDLYINNYYDDESVIRQFLETFRDEADCGAVKAALRILTDDTRPSQSPECTVQIEMLRLEEQIRMIEEANNISWRLLSILAYSKVGTPFTKIKATFRHIFDQDVTEKALSTLADLSLLSVFKKEDDGLRGRETDCVDMEDSVKRWIRNKLLDKNDDNCLIGICNFQILEKLKVGEESDGHLSTLHKYLKDFKWSGNSTYISMIFSVFLTSVAAIQGVGYPDSICKSVSIMEDVYDFWESKAPTESAAVNWYRTDSFSLFQLCLFWVSLEKIEVSHRMWNDSNVSQNMLLNTFLTSIKPSVEYFLHPQTGLLLIQELILRMPMYILKSIPFVMLYVEVDVAKKIQLEVLECVNALEGCATENVLDLFKLLWDFYTNLSLIDSLNYMDTIFKTHFQVYTEALKTWDGDTLERYWESCGPLYFYQIRNWQYFSMADKKDCLFANDGLKILVQYFVFKDKHNLLYSLQHDVQLSSFLFTIAVELNFAGKLIESMEFLESLRTYTRRALEQQGSHYILFNLAAVWFGLFARPGAEKNKEGCTFFFEVVALQLECYIHFIKLHDMVRLTAESTLMLTEHVLQIFLETFADLSDSLAFQTAFQFLDLIRFRKA